NGGSGYSGGFGAGLDSINQTAQISVTDANVITIGDGLPGLAILMQAGAGATGGCQPATQNCDYSDTRHDENGGYGGQVGGSGGLITVTASTVPVQISTNGNQSTGIQAQLLGGLGAAGGFDNAL